MQKKTRFCTSNNNNFKHIWKSATYECQNLELQLEMTIFWESCYFASCTKTTTWTDNPIITYVCDIYFYYKTKILKEKKRQEVALKGMGILKYPKMVPYIKRKQRVTAFRLTKNQLGQVLSIRPLFKNHISFQAK